MKSEKITRYSAFISIIERLYCTPTPKSNQANNYNIIKMYDDFINNVQLYGVKYVLRCDARPLKFTRNLFVITIKALKRKTKGFYEKSVRFETPDFTGP